MKQRFAIPVLGNETGTTVVEFSVVVALLLIILFGMLEFGFIFLQKHLAANAAREGVRIGVRANNFDSFTALTNNTADGCNQSATDRAWQVDCQIRNYLNTLYDRGEPKITVERDPDISPEPDGSKELLKVTVTVPNFFPELLSGLVPGWTTLNHFTYTASGDYENPEEALTETE